MNTIAGFKRDTISPQVLSALERGNVPCPISGVKVQGTGDLENQATAEEVEVRCMTQARIQRAWTYTVYI